MPTEIDSLYEYIRIRKTFIVHLKQEVCLCLSDPQELQSNIKKKQKKNFACPSKNEKHRESWDNNL